MEAEFLIENLEKFLPILSRILPPNTQIPVLSNLLIEATGDGRVVISATSLDLGVRINIPAKTEEAGAITVPGKQFIEALSAFPKDKIKIYQKEDKLMVLSRGGKISFQTIPKEEFPTLFEEKGEKVYTFEKEGMGEIFSKLIFSVSQDDSRPELTGILVAQKDKGIDFVATDGFRLSLKRVLGEKIFEEASLILPARVINEALSLKEDRISLHLYKKANQVIFETESTTLTSRIIGGEFPSYERVIPKTGKTSVVIDREDILQKLKLASVFARESANIIKIKSENGRIKILSSASGLGEGELEAQVEQKGDDFEIAFNVRFLTDALRNMTGSSVTMGVLSSVEPAVFKSEDDPSFTHIIMPVRVQE